MNIIILIIVTYYTTKITNAQFTPIHIITKVLFFSTLK